MKSDLIPQLDLLSLVAAHREEYVEAILKVVTAADFISGKAVADFERKFGEWLGSGIQTVGCANGTDAIQLAARAMVEPGAEALVPAMTFFATVEGLVAAGLRVKLVDVDPISYTLDPKKLKEALSPSTRLIVPVHLYGCMADMEQIREIAQQAKCLVLEDASQAHGAKWASRPVGFWGDAATYSFYPGKNLGAFGDAGAVVAKEVRTLEMVRKLRNHGGLVKNQHQVFGFNSRLDTLQAAVLEIKLKYLDGWNDRRRTLAQIYRQAFSGLQGLVLPQEPPGAHHVYHQFVVLVDNRESFVSHLKKNGVDSGVHYPRALHQLEAMAAYRDQSFPVAERLARDCVSLPMCPMLNNEKIDRVVAAVRSYFRKL